MQAKSYREPLTAEEFGALERCRRKLDACAAEGFIKHYDVHGIVGDGPEISYSVDGWSMPRRVTVGRDFLWIRV